ncbi:Putative aminoacrylate hydrolase RutD [BD1-7 clade bacterium]|uniref:Aminoacrylate hydrolase RutD n=1 Tax=BD1-7 clade bacterium TaxID=2029982 RepID=A0A5S9PT45_9GAMM|nr:Putative aminoacrylate hydrolase RutD [BD1-7 clade bacterium]
MPDNALIKLIYQSAVEQGSFLELLEMINQKDAVSLDEKDLLAHFDQANAILEQMAQLQHKQTVAESVFNHLRTGIVLLDIDLNVVFANQPAETLLAEAQGFGIQSDTLLVHDRDLQTVLLNALADWNNGQARQSETLFIESTEQQHIAVLSPIADVVGLLAMRIPSSAVAALFISYGSNDQSLRLEQLEKLYGLTRVEADVTCRIAAGQTIDEIADARSSKSQTIRTYLKAIFSKTGTRRQADLVALVLKAPLQTSRTSGLLGVEGEDRFVDSAKRHIAYRVYGSATGTPIVICHPSLSCRLCVPVGFTDNDAKKVRIIVPDRAGIGQSSGPLYESITDFNDDLLAIMAAEKLEQVRLVGVAAGGAFALGFAAEQPSAVLDVLLMESFAPGVDERSIKGAPGYFKWLPPLVRRFPGVGEKLLNIMSKEFARDWEGTLGHVSTLFNARDAEVIIGNEVREHALAQGAENTRHGVQGFVRDMLLVHNSWPFELGDIQVTCHLAYGAADPVAEAYAEALSERLPDVDSTLYSGEGFAGMVYLRFFDILRDIRWI